jgi:hypothetical protein
MRSIAPVSRLALRRSHWRRSTHCMSCQSPSNHSWSPRTATSSRGRRRMGSLLSLARRTELAPRLDHTPPPAPRQLDLVLDDVRLQGMTPVERQAALRSLANLLLGVATARRSSLCASRRRSKCNRTLRVSGASTSWSMSRGGAASAMSRSSTTISADLRVPWSPAGFRPVGCGSVRQPGRRGALP